MSLSHTTKSYGYEKTLACICRVYGSSNLHKSLSSMCSNNGGGTYALFRITKVSYPEKVDDGRRKALQREYGTILGQEDFAAYLAGLRQRYKIDINRSALESKER